MPEKDAFADRRRALEEEYFQKKEKELIEKLHRRAALEAERRKLSEMIGVSDQDILNDLQELGYTAETLNLLHLVPLVQVAWAEGEVSSRERELILEAAIARGIKEGSAAYEKLNGWLTKRPDEEFFEETLRIIAAIIESLPAEKRAAGESNLLSHCERIAEASGGILGIGRVSDEERKALKRIASELERDHRDAAREVIEKR
ncbi:MAG TPA: hypothetical protein VNO14_13895 [Blastocatellia bacterium]|nr:hypothetical protein [Blastocatellia bacterium]